MTLMGTAADFTKSQAEREKFRLMDRYGGTWTIEQVGRKWCVKQLATESELKAELERKTAEITLNPDYGWFNDKHNFASIYRTRDQLKEKLDKWGERFAKCPIDAFRSGTDAVQDAATYDVVNSIITDYESGVSEDKICGNLENYAAMQTSSESLSNSSSPMSNLSDRAKRIAIAKLAVSMRNYLNNIAAARGTLAVL